MNMPAFNLHSLKLNPSDSVIPQVMATTAGKWHSAFDLFENDLAVFQMLDARFPLQERSHEDVKQYIVYFNHVMVFFADGTHCGLDQSKQFVAFNGSRENPSSILFQEDDLHVELLFNCTSKKGKQNLAGIEDVQIEFPTKREFVTPSGNEYKV